MDNQIQLLRERFSQMEDEDLLRIVGQEAADYRPEALEVAREEIKRRGLDTAGVSKTDVPDALAALEDEESLAPEEDLDEDDAPEPEVLLCPACGSGLRSAVLLAENQIIAVFDDNREARFVKLLICPRCGTADMFVDMHTRVTE
ncbi:MAG: hypothetical protein EHM18_00475 [Acidobacteria bacterium]|nr:MAG: hypothetical protein EHM18_00475 [Acidobacteriota bacterium]